MRYTGSQSKGFSILSWVVLAGAVLTAVFLAACIVWVWCRTVLTAETFVPEYQGLSLPARYLHILSAGFLNTTWGLALAGTALVWFWAWRNGAAAKRLALAVSLIFVHQWLLLTVLFLLMFSEMKT